MITWTLTSGDRRADGAGTSYPEALAEALDAVLCLYDAHTADGEQGPGPGSGSGGCAAGGSHWV